MFFERGQRPPAREIQSSYRLYGGVWRIWTDDEKGNPMLRDEVAGTI